MTTNPSKADSHLITQARNWREREAVLLAGKAVPGRRDREAGHSPFQNSALLDLRQMLDIELNRDELNHDLTAVLSHCHAVPSASAIWEAVQAIPADGWGRGLEHLRADLLWHAALRAHRPAVAELLATTLQSPSRYNAVAWVYSLSLAVGLTHAGSNDSPGDELDAVDVEEYRDRGLAQLDHLGSILAAVRLAADEVDALADAEAEASPAFQALLAKMKSEQEKRQAEEDAAMAEAVMDVVEDRAESRQGPGLVVIDGDPKAKPSGARGDVFKSMKSVIGAHLRLVTTDRLASARTELHARYPHMTLEIDAILSTQSALRVARLAVMLVGEPGSGKTTFARDLADLLGIPSMVYSCAGASDGAFGGTSAQWNSARASTPLQHVTRTLTANPMLILDEVDKMGSSRHNGSLADTLLSFLEPTSSRAFHDLALEQSVDLSAVSYVATANVLEDVPVALRDRFKIVRIPSPGFEHVGVLSQRIIDDLAKQRGLDRRWIEPLAQDETELVKKAWPGGSLRTLTRIVTTIVDGRDAYLGRA